MYLEMPMLLFSKSYNKSNTIITYMWENNSFILKYYFGKFHYRAYLRIIFHLILEAKNVLE